MTEKSPNDDGNGNNENIDDNMIDVEQLEEVNEIFDQVEKANNVPDVNPEANDENTIQDTVS